MVKKWLCLLLISVVAFSCSDDNGNPATGDFNLSYIYVGGMQIAEGETNTGIPVDQNLSIKFSSSVLEESVEENIQIFHNAQAIDFTFDFLDDNTLIVIRKETLEENTDYQLVVTDQLKDIEGRTFSGTQVSFRTLTRPIELESISIDGKHITNFNQRVLDVKLTPSFDVEFSLPVNEDDIKNYTTLKLNGSNRELTFSQVNDHTIRVSSVEDLTGYTNYQFQISEEIENTLNRPFETLNINFYTQLDSTYKFPEISDDALLTKIQEQTFKYFWDFAHPTSGLARERNSSGDVVTIGGSGFGVMAILVGIERNFITREQGVERLTTIVDFLTDADRFHGVWPHWMNGNTGATIPFSTEDNGADLVETAFMIEGLLTVRAYLSSANPDELALKNKITTLWEEVEWSWFTKDGENVLYWHWSPDYEWAMNLPIRGWNESLIVYVLAAASPTYPIEKEVYDEGWARNGGNANGQEYYGVTLPLGYDRGGPLFFAHYSFLGLDPRNLEDQYANYWEQNVAHTKINQLYCANNPLNYVGYGAEAWGLTASDNHEGYNAHSPTNDLGVITPTAAISSIPYTPEESMNAIHHFYYLLGDKLWGDYGFYDAYNNTEGWYANSYLAIDQGPIVSMIENYRSGLLWTHFMSDAEVQAGLTKLGFTY